MSLSRINFFGISSRMSFPNTVHLNLSGTIPNEASSSFNKSPSGPLLLPTISTFNVEYPVRLCVYVPFSFKPLSLADILIRDVPTEFWSGFIKI